MGGGAAAGTYDARDLVRLPGLISLARLPLAVVFPFVSGHAAWAIAVLTAAAVSDVLDGWTARRYGQQSLTGAVLDGTMDKLFVTTVLVTLVVQRGLTIVQLLILSAREIGQIPLLVRALMRPRGQPRGARAANVLGKIATVAQFASVVAVLLGAPHRDLLVYATGALGVAAVVIYWYRDLSG